MSTAAQRWGIEIEGYGLTRPRVAQLIEDTVDEACLYTDSHNPSTPILWAVVHDGSLGSAETKQFEIRTPVMSGEVEAFRQIRRVCSVLRRNGAYVNRRCGLHVHHDASLALKALRRADRRRSIATCYNILTGVAEQLYERLEPVIDSLMPHSRRGNNNPYCTSMIVTPGLLPEGPYEEFRGRRVGRDPHHVKLSTSSLGIHQTLEYRQHSGTLNPSKITAWVKLTWLIHNRIIDEALNPNRRLPATFTSVEDMMQYLGATDNLTSYYVQRRDAFEAATPPTPKSHWCETFWLCNEHEACVGLKELVDYCVRLLFSYNTPTGDAYWPIANPTVFYPYVAGWQETRGQSVYRIFNRLRSQRLHHLTPTTKATWYPSLVEQLTLAFPGIPVAALELTGERRAIPHLGSILDREWFENAVPTPEVSEDVVEVPDDLDYAERTPPAFLAQTRALAAPTPVEETEIFEDEAATLEEERLPRGQEDVTTCYPHRLRVEPTLIFEYPTTMTFTTTINNNTTEGG